MGVAAILWRAFDKSDRFFIFAIAPESRADRKLPTKSDLSFRLAACYCRDVSELCPILCPISIMIHSSWAHSKV